MSDTIGLAVAAKKLGIAYQDAHRLLLLGRLTGEKCGGRWYVSTSSVEDLAAERQGARGAG